MTFVIVLAMLKLIGLFIILAVVVALIGWTIIMEHKGYSGIGGRTLFAAVRDTSLQPYGYLVSH
ncbi:hypothetical protein M1512_03725 [Patescibacteria group bacterium]|nr:hypothetical protein [Patescibacteria group bacterium]